MYDVKVYEIWWNSNHEIFIQGEDLRLCIRVLISP